MGEAQEPWMTDAEIKHAVIGMLTAAIEFAARGEMDPGLVAAFAAPMGVQGKVPITPPKGAMTPAEVLPLIEAAVQDATGQVEAHYRKVLLYLVDMYLKLAGEALAVDVNPLALLQQSALSEDPPLPF
jgi:hypothetical protein